MEYLTTQQVAERLGVKRARVLQLIKCGDLRAEHAGRAWLIKPEWVAEYETRRPVHGWPKGKRRKSE